MGAGEDDETAPEKEVTDSYASGGIAATLRRSKKELEHSGITSRMTPSVRRIVNRKKEGNSAKTTKKIVLKKEVH